MSLKINHCHFCNSDVVARVKRATQCTRCGRRDWDKKPTSKSRKRFTCDKCGLIRVDFVLNPTKTCKNCDPQEKKIPKKTKKFWGGVSKELTEL